ncbi:carboxylate--amine ligase [Romboutsia sp.]|uniref:carboxylate--amine ligase n=1 Tax=Romboutsia sp. TaxID=1965302 RepID=UPI003F2B8E70
MEKINIQPVLIGGDLNCYNVARAYHEAYGVTSIAVGRYELGATKDSKIIKFIVEPNINDNDYFVERVLKLADEIEEKGKQLILVGCTDEYAELIIDNRDVLSKKYITPYIDKDLKDSLISKENFYEICEKHGLDYPKTYIYSKGQPVSDVKFNYPIIVKPSDSVSFWRNPFEGMKKAYLVNSEKEFQQIVDEIYAGKYEDNLIIQDFIPGDDSKMRVLTAYSDRNGKVKMMCLGHVLLEEHTPKGIGNHAAIITEYNEEVMMKFKEFLESINYTGFSNFDIKYDERDNTYKVFEINLRQGRSNYYVTGSNNNIANLVVEDRVLNKDMELKLCKDEHFWRVIPLNVVYKFVKDEEIKAKAKKLISEGKWTSSFNYKYDLKGNFKRRLYITLYDINQMKKFKKYCK